MLQKITRAVSGAVLLGAASNIAEAQTNIIVNLPQPYIGGQAALNACAHTDVRLSMYLTSLAIHFNNAEYAKLSGPQLDNKAVEFVENGLMSEEDWARLYWPYNTPQEKAHFLSAYAAKEVFAQAVSTQTGGGTTIADLREHCGPQARIDVPAFPGR